MDISQIETTYRLKLYITGQTMKSDLAVGNIHKIFEDLSIPFELTIIDVLERPDLAEEDMVLATPTLIKTSPMPVRRIIGDLSDKKSVKIGLGLTLYEKKNQ
jgi:circadian clock protein KaiB